jgi:hypothetical protein
MIAGTSETFSSWKKKKKKREEEEEERERERGGGGREKFMRAIKISSTGEMDRRNY